MALVARVLPDVAGFDKELDYSVPPTMAGQLRPGSVVRVPLQGRRVRGWVLAFPVEPPAGVSLRPIAKVTGWGPEPELFGLASWAAHRWAARRRSLLVTASAEGAVRALPPPALDAVPRQRTPATGSDLRQGNLARSPGSTNSDAAAPAAPAARAGRTGAMLVAQAWRPGPQLLRLPPATSAFELVVAAAERGPVLVLVPTIARAEAGSAAIRARGASVALLPRDWAHARAGSRVVIGSRGAAWGPCPRMASVVVLDAHDEAYVQGPAPTWDAPLVAAERARRAGVPCFWVTPCPTLELLAAAERTYLPSRSEERGGWAVLLVVDRRREDPRAGLYSRQLVTLLRGGGRVVCVLNRKGRAQLVDCAACGELATCERCGSSVAMVASSRPAVRSEPAGPAEVGAPEAAGLAGVGPGGPAGRPSAAPEELLQCRRCGETRPVVCAKCGSTTLRARRPGIAGAREQLEALGGRPTGEVAAGTGPLPATPVLVGTEAVLYREAEVQRTGGATAVAFLDFDQELLAPRYRAGEEALALLARASRLVGGRAGQVLVQTRVPSHPVLKAAVLADPGRLAAAEEPVRKELRLPPFSALALLVGPGAGDMAGAISDSLGPGGTAGAGQPLEVSQVGDDRWVVRAPDHEVLAGALAAVGRPSKRVRVEVGPSRL